MTALVAEEGRVVGAAWKSFESTGHVRAGAVVIAAGGFVMNEEMVATYQQNASQLKISEYPPK